MKQLFRHHILFPLALFTPILLDGLLSIYVNDLFITTDFHMVSQLTYVMFFMAMFISPNRHYIAWGFAVGLVYDFYYSPVLSFYTAPFLLAVYVVYSIRPLLYRSLLVYVAVAALYIFLINVSQYAIASIFQLTWLDFWQYLLIKVMPTMFLNVLYVFILYPVCQKIYIALENDKKINRMR